MKQGRPRAKQKEEDALPGCKRQDAFPKEERSSITKLSALSVVVQGELKWRWPQARIRSLSAFEFHVLIQQISGKDATL